MASIELEIAISAFPALGERITVREWSNRLPPDVGSPNPKTRQLQLRNSYYRWREAGLLEGRVAEEKRIEHGRIRYYFSRTVPQIYNPSEQVVDLVTGPSIIPSLPRAPLIPRLIHVGDRFRRIAPS